MVITYKYKHLKPYLQDLLEGIKERRGYRGFTQIFRYDMEFPAALTKEQLLDNRKRFSQYYQRNIEYLLEMVINQQTFGTKQEGEFLMQYGSDDEPYEESVVVRTLPKNRRYFATKFEVKDIPVYELGFEQPTHRIIIYMEVGYD